MAEYINREKAKAYLIGDYAYAAAKVIDEVLSADVVEVVRCKNCKHFCPYEGEEHKGDCAELVGLESCVYEDDFCSYGERRSI
jgi:hypothetical protein